MRLYRKILACLDGSEESFHAFEEAVKFSKDSGITVFALTVAPTYHGDISLIGIGLSLEELNKPYKDTLSRAKDIGNRYGVLVKSLYEEGESFGKIVDISVEISADLIVMGKKGMSALREVLLGSVTERVIGYSNIDVLIVPKDALIKWDKTLVAVDVSPYGDRICSRAIEIAKNFYSEMNIISVLEVPSEVFAIKPEIFDNQMEKVKKYLKNLEMKFQKENISVNTILEEGEPYRKILETAEKINADLIVIGSHGRTGLKRLLMGSTCQRVIGLSKIPTLIVK